MATAVWDTDYVKGASTQTPIAELTWPVIDLNPEDWKEIVEPMEATNGERA